MSGNMLEMRSLSKVAKPVGSLAARPVAERHRNWSHLSVFILLTLAMMAALAGAGVLLFLLLDKLISVLR